MKPRIESTAASTAGKFFGLVVVACFGVAAVATTIKYVTVLFS